MEAFRTGFSSVFSLDPMRIFSLLEVDRVFCGLRHSEWNVEELNDACKPDHGYTSESAVVQWFYEVLSSFDRDEQRQFVSFVTGSPNLPVGGFCSLQPRLTIVPKSRGPQADLELPSVMTCQNYVKLPEFSSKAILSAKLRLAVCEGQGSFLLS
jgi:E3 ubiquitin-protein ligase TRIP12